MKVRANIGDVPALSANKYLKVNSSANGLEWADAGGSVPSNITVNNITGGTSFNPGTNHFAANPHTANLLVSNATSFNGLVFMYGSVSCTGHSNHQGTLGLGVENGIFRGWAAGHSDDRIKFNEVNITNGLEVIRQLKPQVYDKVNSLGGDISKAYKEAGVIAQEVLTINDLSFAVIGGGDDSLYGVKYEDVFTYNLAATKELDMIVKLQGEKINGLDLSVNMLESLLSSSDLSVNRLELKVDILERELENIKAILSTANLYA